MPTHWCIGFGADHDSKILATRQSDGGVKVGFPKQRISLPLSLLFQIWIVSQRNTFKHEGAVRSPRMAVHCKTLSNHPPLRNVQPAFLSCRLTPVLPQLRYTTMTTTKCSTPPPPSSTKHGGLLYSGSPSVQPSILTWW